MKSLEQERVRRFAFRYLQTLDAEMAAEGGDGIALLSKSAVQKEIGRQRQLLAQQMTKADSLRRLYRLVFGRCNDCVKLVMTEAVDLDSLDLSLLSELKRSEKGALEVKLLNRAELLRLLLDAEGEDNSGALELLKALGEDD